MSEPLTAGSLRARGLLSDEVVRRRLERRYAAERRFRFLCRGAVVVALLFLALLFTDIVAKGHGAFVRSTATLEIVFDPEVIDPRGARDPGALARADYDRLVRAALERRFPGVSGRADRRRLTGLISDGGAYELQRRVLDRPELIGQTRRVALPVSDDADMLLKGLISREVPEGARRISDREIGWLDALAADGLIERRFNWSFFTQGDSREPELAAIGGAIVGSAYTLLVTLLLAFPLGLAAALYLEQFAPRNRWTDLIEVNINNLAAVPSIVYGLLGLAVLLNFLHLPRSAPLVGGIVLALMTLPRIIIPARAALQSVPPSILEAAYGLGASRVQVIVHHLLPLALPGILTGTIIGMAQALGESAPLLMIGMVAFIADVPGGPLDPATVLPVQIFLWADSPERAFVEKTAAAILVLLGFLVLMNLTAVILRRRTERRW
ncbi:MAG: phosphate ABC transporter permease PstA [Thermoanaerobaculia bacterium]|nr:phosphate ABC transporter permease PstA [Thermoanaerobaculia bacterium]